MATCNALVLRAPGTNCDVETAHALELAGARAQRVHVNRLIEDPAMVQQFQILCVPGGFSYGDDVAAGRILAGRIRHRLADAFVRFRDDEKLILGICNGFQVLLQTGLLTADGAATLAWNDSGRFEDRWVHLQVPRTECVFFRGVDRLYLPVAHAEGKFVAGGDAPLARLEEESRIVLRYADAAPADEGPVAYPANPNGSMGGVAGICDATGRVCGLMPHPERHVVRTQHPRWTRGEADEVGAGLVVFENAVRYFG